MSEERPKYCYRKGRKGYLYFVRGTFIRRLPEIDDAAFAAAYETAMEEHDSLVIGPDAKAANGRMMQKNEVDQHFASIQRGAMDRAKRAGRDYSLPKHWAADQYFAQKGYCALSGVAMRKPISQWDPYGPSIDRIDSDQGYLPENCQLVALQVNRAKNNISEEEFIRMCERVIQQTRDKARTQREFGETFEAQI